MEKVGPSSYEVKGGYNSNLKTNPKYRYVYYHYIQI